MMKMATPAAKWLVVLTSLFVIAACSNMSPEKGAKSGGGHTGAWDADSRNNEDNSLGAKSLISTPGPGEKTFTMDSTIDHINNTIIMNRELADRIAKAASVSSAAVAVTNHSVYVAVDPRGQQTQMAAEQQTQYDPGKGAGLFGSGVGAKLDWHSNEPLAAEQSNTIINEVRSAIPQANVYVSTNPHFVSRMMFYDTQQRQGTVMSDYVNEFNTMVQYAFPDYGNSRNQSLR